MVETASTMLPLGSKATLFNLKDARNNELISLKDYHSKIATVIMFICNHCPYVQHIREKMVEVAKAYQAKGITFIAINSNDINRFPSDSPTNMRMLAEQ